jgi:hypothetical protein
MKQTKTSIANKALSAAIVLSLLGTPALAAYRGQSHDGGRPTITVKSAQDEQVTFEVNVPNAEKQSMQVVIRDAEGNAIYRESASAANYTKTFVFSATEAEKLKFEVYEGKKLVMTNTYRTVRKFEETIDVSLEAGK